jgi:predicted dinucleotide-utilizing enzyme
MVGTVPQFDDGRLKAIIERAHVYRDEKVERAKEELHRRRRNRRRFVRELDDDELREIVNSPSWKMGPYDTRALEAGVDVALSTLEALAEEEIERRERERERAAAEQAADDEVEPFRVVSR